MIDLVNSITLSHVFVMTLYDIYKGLQPNYRGGGSLQNMFQITVITSRASSLYFVDNILNQRSRVISFIATLFMYSMIEFRTKGSITSIDTPVVLSLFTSLYYLIGGDFIYFCLVGNIVVPVAFYLIMTFSKAESHGFFNSFYAHGTANLIFLYCLWNKKKDALIKNATNYIDIIPFIFYNFSINLWFYSVTSSYKANFKQCLKNNTFIDKTNQDLIDNELKNHIENYRNTEYSYGSHIYSSAFNRSITGFTQRYNLHMLKENASRSQLISKYEQWRTLINIYYTYDESQYEVIDNDKKNVPIYKLNRETGTLVSMPGGNYDKDKNYTGAPNGDYVLIDEKYTLIGEDEEFKGTRYRMKGNVGISNVSNAVELYKKITKGNEKDHLQLILRTTLPELYPGVLPFSVVDQYRNGSIFLMSIYIGVRVSIGKIITHYYKN